MNVWEWFDAHPDEREMFAHCMMGITVAHAPAIADSKNSGRREEYLYEPWWLARLRSVHHLLHSANHGQEFR